MKPTQTSKYHVVALAALLLGSAGLAFAQTTTTTVNSFDTMADFTGLGGTPSTGLWYGSSSILWDGTTDDTGNGGGSLYVQSQWTSSSDSPLQIWICFPPYDNYFYNGNTNVNLSQYASVDFDIMWDTVNSDPDFTIGVWNDPSTAPSSWLSSGTLAGSITGLEVDNTSGAGEGSVIGDPGIPTGAATWQHVSIPMTAANSPGTDGSCGIMLHKYLANHANIAGTHTCYFWIDNVQFIGSAAPPPPPTIASLVPATPGLNEVFNTTGQYDRHEVALVSSNGLSWVGHATTLNPVTYSFTINSFPQNVPTYSTAAYLMMSPNPNSLDNALDYNEPNCIQLWLQQGTTTSLMSCQYKTNLPSAVIGTTAGSITNNGTALGTWQLTFTSDTHGILTAPDGTTNGFDLPPDVAAIFAENPVVGQPGFYLYLGCQPNTPGAQNQSVCYSQFSVSGVASAQTDNFLADQVLNTNVWLNGPGSGSPAGNFISPTNAAYWVKWTIPASGYHLQSATDLLGTWNTLTDGPLIAGTETQQLVTTNDVPVGTSSAFFRLMKP